MQQLLKELFAAYYQDVYSYLYSFSRDAALSEDMASEVFLEAVKSIGRFRGEADMKTWLFSIARHKWFGHLRKKNHSLQALPLEDVCAVTDKTPESLYMQKELAERILSLLTQEPERTRKVLAMRMEGYSFHEIGRALGISESSARVIAYRAKTKIRQILEKEGFEDA